MDRFFFPWSFTEIRRYSDAELIQICEEIERRLRNGEGGFPSGMLLTHSRIRSALSARDLLTVDPFMGFTLGGLGGVGYHHRASPGVVIGQTVQQGVINVPAPQPNITFQTISAPPPNFNFQTIQAPKSAVPLPAPELPKRIRFRNQWGNIVEERDETEQEKGDREYEEWKAKFGAN